MNLNEAETHFSEMFEELREMKTSPWPFLCAATMLEYLAKMAEGEGREAYKTFVRNYLRPPAYRDFTFANGQSDLPEQIYHVLRNGLVHSFSLTPDRQGRSAGGRDESVVIADGGNHLAKYLGTDGHHQDAVCLVRRDFLDDIEVAMRKVFADAPNDAELRRKIEEHLTRNPPVQPLQQPSISAQSQFASGSAHGWHVPASGSPWWRTP